MSSENQTIVELEPSSTGGALGERDESKIKASFVGCPTFEGSYSIDNDVRRLYMAEALEASDVDGYGFADFNTNYLENGAPDLSTCVEAGADNSGGPQLGYALTAESDGTKSWPIPNSVSAKGATWTAQPAPVYPAGVNPPTQTNINYGSGPDGPTSPSKTSDDIATQNPWDLVLGSST